MMGEECRAAAQMGERRREATCIRLLLLIQEVVIIPFTVPA
jgi:hypothetical protein